MRSTVTGVTATPSSRSTLAIQAASRVRSRSSTSTSRRRESSRTNQTSPAPTTSPTMSSHQLNSAFTAAKYREASPAATAAVDATLRPCSPSPRSHRLPPRSVGHRLVRAVLCDRARGGVPAPRLAGPTGGRGPRRRRQRDHRRRGRRADRRSGISRHRPVGALRERPAEDHPAAVLRPRGVRRDRERHVGGVVVRAATERAVRALGGHHRAVAVRDAGDRPLGQLLQPGALRSADDLGARHPDRLRPPTCHLRLPGRARGDALPPAVPVRIDLGDRRGGRAHLHRLPVPLAPAAGRPAVALLRLVRHHPVRARVPARGQLDLLRGPDRPDRVPRLHRRRAHRAGAPASRECGR